MTEADGLRAGDSGTEFAEMEWLTQAELSGRPKLCFGVGCHRTTFNGLMTSISGLKNNEYCLHRPLFSDPKYTSR